MEDKTLIKAKEELERLDRQCAKANHFYVIGYIGKDELIEQYNAYYRQKVRVNELEKPDLSADLEYYKEQFRNL